MPSCHISCHQWLQYCAVKGLGLLWEGWALLLVWDHSLVMRDQCEGQARALSPTGTLLCTSSFAVLCLSFPWSFFSPWCS